MSLESLAIVLHHSKARGTAKLVALGIANHDGDGGAYPSMRTLAKYANVDVRNARKAVSRLVELAEIRVEVQGGGEWDWDDELRPNRYELLLACPPACDRTKHHRMPGEQVTPPLWKTPGRNRPGVTQSSGGPPDGIVRLTNPQTTPPAGSAQTAGQARPRTPGPRCTECDQHEHRCTESQSKLHLSDRHPFTPPTKGTTP